MAARPAVTARIVAFVAVFVLALAGDVSSAGAVEPDEVLADPALEARARELSKELRCLVCQNQSIDDSDAELARDLRVLVRERIAAGDNDEQVIDYVVSRYGDFVLLSPPFQTNTLLLWLGPAVVFVLALAAVLAFYRANRRNTAARPLDPSEEERLAKLMDSSRR